MTTETKSEFRFTLKNVRAAMTSVFAPYKGEDGEGGKYNIKGLMPPDHPQLPEINALMVRVAKAKWGAKADATLKALRVADKTCIHDGDAKPDWDGFAGNLYIAASSKKAPSVRNRDATVITEADGVFYSGCMCDLYLDLWAMDNQFGKRINCTLRGVQFRANADAFAGGPPPASDDEYEVIAAPDEAAGDNDLAA